MDETTQRWGGSVEGRSRGERERISQGSKEWSVSADLGRLTSLSLSLPLEWSLALLSSGHAAPSEIALCPVSLVLLVYDLERMQLERMYGSRFARWKEMNG